jgi:ribonuclease HII
MARYSMASGPSLDRELALRRQGYHVVAGLDEVGRGAWAGPVVACAAVLPLGLPTLEEDLVGIRDSKRLTPARRSQFHERISKLAVSLGLGVVSSSRLDELGVVAATKLAMKRALDGLAVSPDYLLVDGFPLAYRGLPHVGLPGGDDLCMSISAASIVAKVERDRMMVILDGVYPGFDFGQHKGYGTPRHREALERLGPCPVHRLSYAPMKYTFEGQGVNPGQTGASNRRAQLGRRGERMAAKHLEEQGYVICQTNYRCEVGEMDIVALDGECLAFVEVRTRKSRKYGSPEESITAAKRQKLIEVAQTYLQEHESEPLDWRIDVVSIQLSPQGEMERLALIKNAVEG